ncbi:MAG TPA: NAD(P)-dependent oxidoreductase [Bacteroidetes bacterium]|nr:NAD(P)-dependent oxidoreductase [Bacteroidota bacterium]
MNVLITGGAGFIAYHFAKYLLDKAKKIDLVDNLQRGVLDIEIQKLIQNKNVQFYERNLLDKNALSDFDTDYTHVFHFAAIIGVKHVLERPYDVLVNNQVLLHNIIEFSRKQSKIQRLVFTSTSEIYAGSLLYKHLKIPTPESAMLAVSPLDQARTSYMLSKIYGEAMCLQSKVPTTIIRPHNFYGPRMGLSHVIPEKFNEIYSAKEEEEILVQSPDHSRSFCYIDDAVEIIYRLCLSKESINQAYNVGNEEEEVKILDLVKKMIKISKKNLKTKQGETHSGSPSRRCPDMTKANKIFYKEQKPLEYGLEKTYQWYCSKVFETNGETAI